MYRLVVVKLWRIQDMFIVAKLSVAFAERWFSFVAEVVQVSMQVHHARRRLGWDVCHVDITYRETIEHARKPAEKILSISPAVMIATHQIFPSRYRGKDGLELLFCAKVYVPQYVKYIFPFNYPRHILND